MEPKKIKELLEDLNFDVSPEPTTGLSEEEVKQKGEEALNRFIDVFAPKKEIEPDNDSQE